jgi:hypothetical protein
MNGRRGLVALTAAQSAGQAGQWAAWLATVYAALERPHAALWIAVVTVAWCIPQTFAMVIGRVVDAWGPRWTGGATWALTAAAAIVPVVTRPGITGLATILAVTALYGTWAIAAGEAVPTWLPGATQTEGGAALSAATSVTVALAALTGTWLVVHTGQRGAWALVAGLSAAGAVISLAIPATRPAFERRRPYRLPPAVRRMLLLTAGQWLVLGIVSATEALYVIDVLHTRYVVYGWLLVTYGLAGIAAGLAAVRWPRLAEAPGAAAGAALVFAVGLVLYMGTADIMVASAGAAVFGAGTALARISIRKVITGHTPEQHHGRVTALWESVQATALTAGPVAAGFLVTACGLRPVLYGACGLAVAVALGYAGSGRSHSAAYLRAGAFLTVCAGAMAVVSWQIVAILSTGH